MNYKGNLTAIFFTKKKKRKKKSFQRQNAGKSQKNKIFVCDCDVLSGVCFPLSLSLSPFLILRMEITFFMVIEVVEEERREGSGESRKEIIYNYFDTVCSFHYDSRLLHYCAFSTLLT